MTGTASSKSNRIIFFVTFSSQACTQHLEYGIQLYTLYVLISNRKREKKAKTKWVLFKIGDAHRSPGFDCRSRSRLFSFLRSLGGLSDKSNEPLTYTVCGKVCQLLAEGRRFTLGTPVFLPVQLTATIRP